MVQVALPLLSVHVTEMASDSAGFTLATDIQVTLIDPEGISQVKTGKMKPIKASSVALW